MFLSYKQKQLYNKILPKILNLIGQDYEKKLLKLSEGPNIPAGYHLIDANFIMELMMGVAFPRERDGSFKHSFQGRIDLVKQLEDEINKQYEKVMFKELFGK